MGIRTPLELQSLQDETMVYAAIIGAVALSLSFIVASLIPYKGCNDRSYITRRIWYVIIGLTAAAVFYIYNDLIVKPDITKAGWQSMFSDTNLFCIGINLGVYFVGGIIIMFVFRHKKFGSILGKEKNA